jgi:hypothetical protein
MLVPLLNVNIVKCLEPCVYSEEDTLCAYFKVKLVDIDNF